MSLPAYLRYTAVSAAVVALSVISPLAISIALASLAAFSVFGVTAALQAMTLSVMIKILNPAITGFPSNAGLLFWLVPVMASARLLFELRSADVRKLAPLWLFGLLAAILSLGTSPNVLISVFKVAAFLLIISGVLVAAQRITPRELSTLTTWMTSLATVLFLGSVATIKFPAIGYYLNGVGFQGITNHPQTLGVLLAPLLAYSLASLLLMRGRHRILLSAFCISLFAMVIMTQARTAAIAGLFGVAVTGLLRLARGRREIHQTGTPRLLLVSAALILAGIIAVASSAQIQESLLTFILKRDASDLSSAFYSSRGAGIENQWQWFLHSPLIGNGFGVYSNGEFRDGIVSVFGIPISAPVEKGFLPSAVLEETGILGFSVFLWLMISVGRAAVATSHLPWIATFFAVLCTNIGEALLLSSGGNGLLLWILIALAIASNRQSTQLHRRPSHQNAALHPAAGRLASTPSL